VNNAILPKYSAVNTYFNKVSIVLVLRKVYL